MSKIITVFGATGNQGGSVIRSLLADPVLAKEYKIRGITRDVTKEAAKKLSSQGVEMITVISMLKGKSIDMKLTNLTRRICHLHHPSMKRSRAPTQFSW